MTSRQVPIDDKGNTIEVAVDEIEGVHFIFVDGVTWVSTPNRVHAAVLYNMIADHITEYMNFEAL